MKKKILIGLFIAITATIVLSTCRFDSDMPSDGIARSVSASAESSFQEGIVIVVLKKGVSARFLEHTAADFPELHLESVRELTGGMSVQVQHQLEAQRTGGWSRQERMRGNGFLINTEDYRTILSLTLADKSYESVRNAIRLLEQRPDVLSAEPNFRFTLFNTFPSGSLDLFHKHQEEIFKRMGVPYAWTVETGLETVIVGVVDSGIDHPELNYFIDFNLSDCTHDPIGHGTMVASQIISAGYRMAGMTHNIKLVSLNVISSTGGETYQLFMSDIIEAIDFATVNYVDILNLSLGGSGDDKQEIQALRRAIKVFPGLVVAAAGNEGFDLDNPYTRVFPAAFNLPNLITVGATKFDSDERADSSDWGIGFGSNYGKTTVDVFAPGTRMLAAFPTFICDRNDPRICIRDNYNHLFNCVVPGYHFDSGTSFSAPLVSGLAALLWSSYRRNHIEITAQEIKQIIMDTVDKVPELADISVSGGRLNAYRALKMAISLPPVTLIHNADGLRNALESNPHGHFRLANDIHLPEERWGALNPWEPIPEFHGVLDGNGRSISNLRILSFYEGEWGEDFFIGMFRENHGTIYNLTIHAELDIEEVMPDHVYAGILAGVNFGVIEDIIIFGVPSPSYMITKNTMDHKLFSGFSRVLSSWTGGIAGCNEGTIRHSTNHGNLIVGTNWEGNADGIAGYNADGAFLQNNRNYGQIQFYVLYDFLQMMKTKGLALPQGLLYLLERSEKRFYSEEIQERLNRIR